LPQIIVDLAHQNLRIIRRPISHLQIPTIELLQPLHAPEQVFANADKGLDVDFLIRVEPPTRRGPGREVLEHDEDSLDALWRFRRVRIVEIRDLD
jgi:hypothetical protein